MHPGWDATASAQHPTDDISDFNSCIPGGMQRCEGVIYNSKTDFNSCIPGGMQRILTKIGIKILKFQFMHPGWDATPMGGVLFLFT